MNPAGKEKLDYQLARQRLVCLFQEAEAAYLAGTSPTVPPQIKEAADILFHSSTQSYRETLLGCGLARMLDPTINIRLPYTQLGPNAFSGRTLDERVVNPFLHEQNIPCSKGPYLATFRRSVQFDKDTAQGLRDKKGYEAFLDFLSAFEQAQTEEEIQNLLRYLLYRFVQLRETAHIKLARVVRLSLEQYDQLIDGLLEEKSGGLIPVLLAVAMFKTLCQYFNLDWEIQWQGINVADKASGAGGDITIRRAGQVLLAIEVTERPIDCSRVVSTFQTKISPQAIQDYLFLLTKHFPDDDARSMALRYFAQGHDVSFLQVKPWLIHLLGTIGARGRQEFTNRFLELLDSPEVPAWLKVRWNQLVERIVSG
jgi:hypothetical protein